MSAEAFPLTPPTTWSQRDVRYVSFDAGESGQRGFRHKDKHMENTTYRAKLYDADGGLLCTVDLDDPTFGEAYAGLADFLTRYTQHNSALVQRATLEPA